MTVKIQMTATAQSEYDRLHQAARKAHENRSTGKKKNSKSSNEEKLFRTLVKTLELMMEANLRHPSLNTHKFDGYRNPFHETQPVFEAYAQNTTPGAYRVFWVYGPNQNEITVIAITPHP